MKAFLIYAAVEIAKFIGAILALPFLFAAWLLLAPFIYLWEGFQRNRPTDQGAGDQ